MKVLSQQLLQKYQAGSAYNIFHGYHPLDDPNQKLVYKKTVPDNLKHQVEEPIKQPNTNNMPATDQTPQNENSYAYNSGNSDAQDSSQNNGTHSSYATIPPKKITQSIPVKNAKPISTEEDYRTKSFAMPHRINENNNQQEKLNFPKQDTVTSDTGNNESEQFKANNYQATSLPNYQAEPSALNSQTQPRTTGNNRPNNVLTHEIAKNNRINNINDENAELYEQIVHVSQELDWIKKVNSFELAYKKDLRNLPISALRVFSTENAKEMLLPFNDGTLLHDVSSITITKDMVIMLLFRNNTSLKLVPENWYNNGNNRNILLKNGFNYFYKSVDANQLKETLKLLSVDYSSTPEFTQFILKTMPFIPAQSN